MICNSGSLMLEPSDVRGISRFLTLRLPRCAPLMEKSRLQLFVLCLIALSLLDLLVTYALLSNFTECYEANPVAQWFFQRWNIFGMAMFKFSLVAVVIVSSEIVERRRTGWGKFLLIFACVASGAVVYQGLDIMAGFYNGEYC